MNILVMVSSPLIYESFTFVPFIIKSCPTNGRSDHGTPRF